MVIGAVFETQGNNLGTVFLPVAAEVMPGPSVVVADVAIWNRERRFTGFTLDSAPVSKALRCW